LPSKSEEEVCLIINDNGLVGLAVSDSKQQPSAIASILEVDEKCLPTLLLSRDEVWKGEVKKSSRGHSCQCSGSSSSPHAACKVPQRIVEAIERYYARQVLEPSIRGFLSILEKQFPRNDLYLFELLQNAVDDGASHVCFKSHKGDAMTGGKSNNNSSSSSSNDGGGLEFFHNGRCFTALDVLGLASVGLSTKGIESSDGPKRTIGFMGVGFKAVYKRYARVAIYDGRFAFSFQEPAAGSAQTSQQPSHGWVLQPRWNNSSSSSGSRWGTSPASSVPNVVVDTEGWCRFQLEKPRGGVRILFYVLPSFLVHDGIFVFVSLMNLLLPSCIL
jgi:hypothetical protein